MSSCGFHIRQRACPTGPARRTAKATAWRHTRVRSAGAWYGQLWCQSSASSRIACSCMWSGYLRASKHRQMRGSRLLSWPSPRLRRGVVPGSPTKKRHQLPSVGMVRLRRELQVLRFSPSESSRHEPQSIAILRSEQHHTPGSPLMSTKIFGSEMATNRLEDQELAMLSSICCKFGLHQHADDSAGAGRSGMAGANGTR